MNHDQRQYDDEEVKDILRRALERQLKHEAIVGTSKTELIETAREIGVSAVDLERAAAEMEAERSGRAELISLEQYTKARQSQKHRSFLTHFSIYTLTTISLIVLNVASPGYAVPWAVLFWWGLVVLTHGASALFSREDPSRLQKQMERERRQQQRMQEREESMRLRREMADTIQRNATELGHAVFRGAGTLLGTLANQISSRTNPRQDLPHFPTRDNQRIYIDAPSKKEEKVSVGSGRTR